MQELTGGNVHVLVASRGHVHGLTLMRVVGKDRAVAQFAHQAKHVVQRRSTPRVQVDIPETNRVRAITELVMPKVAP